LLFSSKPHLV